MNNGKLSFFSLMLTLVILASLIACGGGEAITQTATKTQNQTLTQTERITETQNQTISETETLTKTQNQTLTETQKQTLTETQNQTVTQTATRTENQTITITTTVYTTSSPITTPTTTTPPVTSSTPPDNNESTTFLVSDLILDPKLPAEGSFFTVSVTVTNTGSSQGSYDVVLYIDGIDIQDNNAIISTEIRTKSVNLIAGESIIVIFKKIILPGGYFNLVIDELEEFLESGA
jgi:hypothetical protein